ncbi:MAG TPA: CoA transferase [Dehalococcoidia bacterium]|nr:CoA transferase [Dehalococcoidia bacterium]
MAALPLEGIRVLNFGTVWLGPVFGQTLAFLGAEVYKVESRKQIDVNRLLPPFAEGIQDPDRSLQNHAGWAGNGSITLNLEKPEARELALKLVEMVDVVGENWAPGVIEKLGLSYERLRQVNPRAVLVSIRPAGLYGPLSHLRTYGVTLSSLTGLDSVTGYVGEEPQSFENAFADPLLGVVAAFTALVALRWRDRTGEGCHVDFSQQEGIMQMMVPHIMDYFFNGRVHGPMGNRHPLGLGAPHGVFPCAGDDRWISIACLTEEEWQALVSAMGNPSWASDPRFRTLSDRVRNIDELHAHISRWTVQFNDYELAHRLQQLGVPATPVLHIADLYHDPHFRQRRTFVEVHHPLCFNETIYGSYVKLSDSQPQVRPGPMIGQDNERVFKGLLGMSDEEFQRLVKEEVIF